MIVKYQNVIEKHNQILENGQKWRKELETLKSESF